MGIFRNITRSLKQAAPFIGGSIGFAFGGPIGAALGSGIGSLVGGGDTEDALTAAALGGIAGYAGSKFMGPSNTANTVSSGKQLVGESFGFGAAGPTKVAQVAGDIYPALQKSSSFFTSPTGIATLGLGAAALGSLGEEEEKGTKNFIGDRPYPEGKSRLGKGIIDGMSFDLNNKEERDEYFRRVRAKQGFEKEFELASGGEVEGPGTGTSDSVPARLSDGEFVLTAKAVRGAGSGDRDLGAARMYDMMSELERVA